MGEHVVLREWISEDFRQERKSAFMLIKLSLEYTDHMMIGRRGSYHTDQEQNA
jgi:hypothetical protein